LAPLTSRIAAKITVRSVAPNTLEYRLRIAEPLAKPVGDRKGKATSNVLPSGLKYRPGLAQPLANAASHLEAKATLRGNFLLAAGNRTQRTTYLAPHLVLLNTAGETLDLTLTFADSSPQFFAVPVKVSGLQVYRTEPTQPSAPDRAVSTLRAAQLTFPDVNDLSREVYPTDILTIDTLRGGLLRDLSVHSGLLTADLIGTVHDVRISGRSVMPSYLDSLAAHHEAGVVIGAVAYVLATVLAIARWLRRPTV